MPAAAGCAPNGASIAVAGPTDTVFAYSGTAAEGLGGLAPTTTGIGFQNDRYNAAISALQLGTGGNVLASGAALASALPAPGSAVSISANVRCALGATSTANMTVLEWAPPSASDAGVRLALTVAGVASAAPQLGTASALVSSGLSAPKQGVFDKNGNFYFVWGNYLGIMPGSSGTYRTLLGSGTATRLDGVGTSANLNAPTGIAISADGNTIYWAEAATGMVRQANLVSLQTSTFVGTGGPAYQEGVGTAASFVAPYCLDIDYTRGVMYVADSSGARVRSINMATRQTGTLAGTGVAGNADGAGTSCTFTLPYGVAVHQASGNVYVSDGTGNKIRMVTPTGVCTTFAGPLGNLNGATGAADAQGANAFFSYPRGLSFDANGNLFVADSSNNKIRRITPYGLVTSLTGATNTPGAATTNGGNGGALSAVTFNVPFGCSFDPTTGNLWVIENSGVAVRMLAFSQAPTSVLPVCDNAWHSVSQTFSGGANPQTVRTYIDGYLASSAQLAVATAGVTSSPLSIGNSGEGAAASAASQYVGLISDVRIFARALQPAEALSLSMPVVPIYAGASFSPARSQGVTAYTYSCLPGFAGPAGRTFAQQPDNSWAVSGDPTCVACPVNTFAYSSASGSTCVACNIVDANAVAPPASSQCTCADNFFLSGSGASVTCTACPHGATATGGPSSCTCNANFFSCGIGAGQSCICPAGFATTGTGPTQVCSALTNPGTQSANSASSLITSTFPCSLCPPGSYSATGQSTSSLPCDSCAAGTFSSAGSSSCSPCPPGTFSLAGASSCSLCPAGTYGDRAGLATSDCSGACATCAAGSAAPAAQLCAPSNKRAIPSNLGLQIWPASHPQNPQAVDLVIAPSTLCATLSPDGVCTTASQNQIVGADGVTRYVVGTAAAFHMEAGSSLTCSALS